MKYNLSDINIVKFLCKKHKFNFTKSLGQNFLIDPNVPYEIAEHANIDGIGVIEIGAGVGTLTACLAERAKKVVALELDRTLLPVLEDTLSEYDNVTIINEDILKADLAQIIEEHLGGMDVAVCANLPYYITTPVIMQLLESRLKLKSITVMVQKEVALRLCSDETLKDYGAVSLAVRFYSNPKLLFDVPPSSFIPRPKVFSSVMKMDILETPPVKAEDENFMFKLIKYAFSQRRKTLLNALYNGLNGAVDKNDIAAAISKTGLDENIRGEKLGLNEFAQISNLIYSYIKE